MSPFPEQVDAKRLFARNGEIHASLAFARLPRFAACLADDDGQVEVHLQFGHDEEGRRRLRGTMQGRARQVCQRCLHNLDVELAAELNILIVDDEAARLALPEPLADDADVIVAGVAEGGEGAEGLDVLAIIEDELILGLPLVPLHRDETCSELLNALQQQMQDNEARRQADSKDSHPFAALAALKGQTATAPDDNGEASGNNGEVTGSNTDNKPDKTSGQ